MELEHHPSANLLPRPSDEEYRALVEDIKANGLIQPIVTLDNKILDGISRYEAMTQLGMKVTDKDLKKLKPGKDFDSVSYVLSANLRRRHLTNDQKRELCEKVLKMNPTKSATQVGKEVGLATATVTKMKAEKEAKLDTTTRRVQNEHVDYVVDKKGRKQPAHKPKRASGVSPSRKKTTTSKINQAPKLSSLAWSEASEKARAQFVSAVGLKSLFAAAPKNLRDKFIDDQIRQIKEDSQVKTHFRNGKAVSGVAF